MTKDEVREVIESNKLIADFMGKIWTEDKNLYMKSDLDYVFPESLEYHTSWDWQIVVWRKVNLAVKDVIIAAKYNQPGLYHTELSSKLIALCKRYNDAVFQNDPLKGQEILAEAIH